MLTTPLVVAALALVAGCDEPRLWIDVRRDAPGVSGSIFACTVPENSCNVGDVPLFKEGDDDSTSVGVNVRDEPALIYLFFVQTSTWRFSLDPDRDGRLSVTLHAGDTAPTVDGCDSCSAPMKLP